MSYFAYRTSFIQLLELPQCIYCIRRIGEADNGLCLTKDVDFHASKDVVGKNHSFLKI